MNRTWTTDNTAKSFFGEVRRDENGAIMVIAMVLLAMLTIIGFMSMNRTNTELEIAKNEILYRRNFLRADAVNVIALGVIDGLEGNGTPDPNLLATYCNNDPECLTNFSPPWLYNQRVETADSTNFGNPALWQINSNGTGINCQEVQGFRRRMPDGSLVFDTHFAVVARRVPGGSVDAMGRPQLVTQYEVYSRYASDDGQCVVHSAYRLRG